VNLYAGTTDQALVVSSSAGSFSYPGFVIPASAQPGSYWVSAVGSSSGLAAQAAYDVQVNWPEFGFSTANDESNPYEDTIKSGQRRLAEPGLDLHNRSCDLRAAGCRQRRAVLRLRRRERVRAQRDDTLYALNGTTGALLWSYTTGNWIYSSPTVANGVVYIGSYDYNVYALNATTGAVLWSFNTGDFGGYIDSAPAVANGVVYVANQAGDVDALNAATGTELWNYSALTTFESSPAVADGLVYVGAAGSVGIEHALSAATGQQVWSFQTGASVNAASSVANGVIFVPSEDDTLYALNAATGTELWSYTTGGYLTSQPVIVNGMVYQTGFDGTIYAFSLPGAAEAAARGQARPAVRALRPSRSLKVTR